jgi:hypothetical protein
MQKIASFPFTFTGKTKLGKIFRPYAVISAYSKITNDWESIETVIDSGADYTLLPKKYADILGIDLVKDCLVESTLGVGGAETVYQFKNLPIKIGSWQKEIPVGFLERNDLPALLGRLECLESLCLTFERRESRFMLPQKEIASPGVAKPCKARRPVLWNAIADYRTGNVGELGNSAPTCAH